MSIISQALKKAEQSRGTGRPERQIYQNTLRHRHRLTVIYRAVFAVAVVTFAAGLFGSGYYVFIRSGPSGAEYLAPEAYMQTAVPKEAAPEQVGIGRFSVEEANFHSVGALSAQHGDPLFILSGIAQNEEGFMAVINDQILREGDEIEGARVVRITLNFVELELNEERLILEKSR